ncbi:MAG: hypothetical protein BGO12_12955 [Verrucomicrobia bacterium 61-8]|nr:hypothetical protein [Verrucomicrobiota bacterium]OJV17154.1 MAG: hypothetical protein BGO12_12955 [Verrucomicrobia bacterium 61-8]
MKDNLNDLLKSWQPEVPEPSDFRRNVWKKIERYRPVKETGWLAELFVLFARPRIAFAMVAFAIVVGGVVGREVSAVSQTSDYLRSVNPYAQLR